MAICACGLPLSILKRNLKEILRVAPQDVMAQRVSEALKQIESEKGVITCHSHLAKFGRRYELEVNILVSEHHDWRVSQQDAIRDRLLKNLHSQIDHLWLSVCFTQQEKWL